MKFKQIRTITSLLKEYGLSVGIPTPVGQQQSGATAKLTGKNVSRRSSYASSGDHQMHGSRSPSQAKSQSPSQTKSQSPTINPSSNKKNIMPTLQLKAKDIEIDTVIKDQQGKEAGTIISQLGDEPNTDAIVIKDKTGKYSIAKADDEYIIDNPEFGKLLTNEKQLLRKRRNLKGKIKRLVKKRLTEADPKLYEINFNRKELATSALNAPIKCGFEAETVWQDFSDGAGDDVDNLSFGEVEEFVYFSTGDHESITEDFRQWLIDNKMDDIFDEYINDFIDEHEEDEDYLDDFIEQLELDVEDAVKNYKAEYKDAHPDEFRGREADGWDFGNWSRDLVEEEYLDDFKDYLREIADENGDIYERALETVLEEYSFDDWISENFYSMSSFLDDYGIDYSEISAGGLDDVASAIRLWTDSNSKFNDGHVEVGEYGSTSTDGWAVESDSSIEGYGAGAEIISPVYNSPNEMLGEIKSLFKFMDEEQTIETNTSTGLHVTMSWNGDKEVVGNKLKMAALSGDQYLMGTFGRQKNSYTKSQTKNLKKVAMRLKQNPDNPKSLEDMEDALSTGISSDKFSSINFKGETDRESKNNLVEFRIAGGTDYHKDMAKIIKAVIRYSTLMTAGHEEDAFKQDYINSLFRIINQAGELDPKDISKAQERLNLDNIQSPLVDAYKTLLSKNNYFDGIQDIVNGLENLELHERYAQPGADANWKKQWQKFIKATGKDHRELPSNLKDQLGSINEVEEGEPIKGYIAPTSTKPSILSEEHLRKAQKFYIRALCRLAVDVATNVSRGKINVKNISLFRKSLTDFQLDQASLSQQILYVLNDINIPTQNDRTEQRITVVKKGIDTLFRKKIIDKPDFLSTPQTERLITNIWNALHSEKFKTKEENEIRDLLLQMNFGTSEDNIPPVEQDGDSHHNMIQTWNTAKGRREFNSFYSSMTRSGYNATTPPVKSGEIYYKEPYQELLKFTSKFPKYNEPVSPKHNKNLHNDDDYTTNYLNTYMMKLRKRFAYWEELSRIDPELYLNSIKEVGKFTEKFISEIKSVIGYNDNQALGDVFPDIKGTDYEDWDDGPRLLAWKHWNMSKMQDILDDIVKQDDESLVKSSIVHRLGDVFTDGMREALGAYYHTKETNSNFFKLDPISSLTDHRWKAYKTWMSKFDKVAQKFGFESQADEIKDKRSIEKREKEFAILRQERGKAKLNLPSHSKLFIEKKFWDIITDDDYESRDDYVTHYADEFNNANKGSKVFVIPAAHWNQILEADHVIEMLDDLKGYPLGTSQEWRRRPAQEIIESFRETYGVTWKELQNPDRFINSNSPGISHFSGALQKLGIEITHEGDSREGAPDEKTGMVQTALISKEDSSNSESGEPFNRNSATMWAMNDENNAEAKRFNAHNWENWNPKHIEIIKKAVEGGKTFQIAFADFNDKYGPQIAKDLKKDPFLGNNPDFPYGSHGHLWRGDSDNPGYFYPNDQDLLRNLTSKYPILQGMVDTGITSYVSANFEDLKGFLNNINNDERFKQKTLKILWKREELNMPPITPTEAMRQARMATPESMFSKFDNLPLMEQLKIIEKVSLKKIDKVYEGYWKNVDIERQEAPSSTPEIRPKNPMRTKKPYDPEEHKENFIKSLIAKGKTEQEATKQAWVLTQKGYFDPKNNESINENVPNNTKVRMINKLLADHFPASDLRKQMDAFFAIPDTQMLSDFRHARAESGDDVCLRPILRNYVHRKLNTRLQKLVNLNEGKDELIAKIESLPDDEQTKKLVSYIEQLILDTGAGGRIQSLSAELEVIPDEDISKAITQIAKIVASIEMSPTERAQLFVDWKADTLVNVNALLSTSTVTMKDIYKGYGDKGESHITELVDDLNQVVQYGVGPGEFALAVLSQRIAGIGASGSDEGKGDLLIDSKPVELKTTRKNAARFNDREVTFSPDYKNLVIQFFAKYDQKLEELQKEGVKVKVKSGMQQGHVAEFLKHVPEAEQEVAEIITNIFTNLDVSGGPVARMLAIGDVNGAMQLLAQANVNNYLNKKRQSGNLLGILFIDLKKQTFNFIKEVNDLQGTGLRLHAKTNYLITTNENPFANTSIVPTSQG